MAYVLTRGCNSYCNAFASRVIYRELEARSAHDYIQPSMLAPAAAAWEKWIERSHSQQALDDRDPLFVTLART